ncbi:hypothetical protein B0T14DRAFT_206375 [Immersiella caudata]|uniref:Uncharacterized protein n=1 Tax=Immersiella caudata TaxID=314043 RepID=A0AA40BZL2_9PEZI|nr:hypothetical protein B0T14DRAFT_206375 [Immersiella caudata]
MRPTDHNSNPFFSLSYELTRPFFGGKDIDETTKTTFPHRFYHPSTHRLRISRGGDPRHPPEAKTRPVPSSAPQPEAPLHGAATFFGWGRLQPYSVISFSFERSIVRSQHGIPSDILRQFLIARTFLLGSLSIDFRCLGGVSFSTRRSRL